MKYGFNNLILLSSIGFIFGATLYKVEVDKPFLHYVDCHLVPVEAICVDYDEKKPKFFLIITNFIKNHLPYYASKLMI